MMDTHRRNEDQPMYRYLKMMTILTCIGILFLVTLVSYWSFYPYEPIRTNPKPYLVVFPTDKIVEQGETFMYEIKYNKKSSILPTVQRQFIDGLVFNVAGDTQPIITEVGTGTVRIQVDVPKTLPPGKYTLRITTTYQMNPIRTIRNVNCTEEFEVVSGANSSAEKDARDRHDY